MLFQIYGDTALWQLLGWALVFTGLVLAKEKAPRSNALNRGGGLGAG